MDYYHAIQRFLFNEGQKNYVPPTITQRYKNVQKAPWMHFSHTKQVCTNTIWEVSRHQTKFQTIAFGWSASALIVM